MKFLWLCWILILVLLFNPPISNHFGRRLLIGCSAGREGQNIEGPPVPKEGHRYGQSPGNP
ncbi:hypothetical protein TIFTF001_041221 [Ficus carica]|uniref:Uncharacterized protein n=1 Tax=Ficus carica TaxID=3494 RepID=A0AA88D6Q3_FICCA|nr:hypothetical protein TIFTF001_041221 [Ficus carica]